MKKIKLWLISIILALILPSTLAASTGYAQQGLFGDLIQKLTVTLQEFLTYTLTIPHPYSVGGSSLQEVVPLWSVLAVFTLLFSIIFAASGTISIFKEKNKGPRTAFCIALALIVMFGTPITELFVVTFAGYFTTLTSLLLVVGFLIALWFILFLLPKRGIGAGSKFGAEGSMDRAEGIQRSTEAARIRRDAKIERKDLKRSNKGFKKLWNYLDEDKKVIGDLKQHLMQIKNNLPYVDRLRNEPAALQDAKTKITNELSLVIRMVDSERKIDNKISGIENQIKSIERRDWRTETKEGIDVIGEEKLISKYEKEHKVNLDEANKNNLRNYFMRQRQLELKLIAYTQEIQNLSSQFNAMTTEIHQLIDSAVMNVRNNAFGPADGDITRVIGLLDQQDGMIQRLETMDNEVRNMDRREFQLDKAIMTIERGEQKKVKGELSKEARTAATLKGVMEKKL